MRGELGGGDWTSSPLAATTATTAAWRLRLRLRLRVEGERWSSRLQMHP